MQNKMTKGNKKIKQKNNIIAKKEQRRFNVKLNFSSRF